MWLAGSLARRDDYGGSRLTNSAVRADQIKARDGPSVRQFCASRVWIGPDSSGPQRSEFGPSKPNSALTCGRSPTYDIFEGTAEIQQLVISRAISGMHIK
jgi:hypothetical protein